VSADVLARNGEAALEIVADITARATVPAEGLERVRAERLNELLQQRNEPAAIASKRFANLLYGTGAYGYSVNGTAESIARIALDDVRRFYAQHYVPNNSSIVVSGDIERRAQSIWSRASSATGRGAEPPRPFPRRVPSTRAASTSSIARKPCSRRFASDTSASRARRKTISRSP
jgi:zinc protease